MKICGLRRNFQSEYYLHFGPPSKTDEWFKSSGRFKKHFLLFLKMQVSFVVLRIYQWLCSAFRECVDSHAKNKENDQEKKKWANIV